MFRTILACAIILTGACGGESLIGPPPVYGTYDLSRLNGKSLPAIIAAETGGAPTVLTSGTLVLDANGSAIAEVALLAVANGDTIRGSGRLNGTYTVGHDTLYFRDASDGSVYPALLRGDRVEAVYENVSYSFVRRSNDS